MAGNLLVNRRPQNRFRVTVRIKMITRCVSKGFPVLALVAAAMVVVASCGGGDIGSPGGTIKPPPTGGGDFAMISVNGAPQTVYTEASGLPSIDCDPRVDWAFSQVIGWANFTGGSGPNGYELFFDFMFPAADTVGTYTVQGDNMQAMFYNNEYFMASPIIPTSSGTVQVTRADTRIEGTFTIVAVDSLGTTQVSFDGSFGIDKGISLICP